MEEHDEKGRAQVQSVIRVAIAVAVIVLVGFGILAGWRAGLAQLVRLAITLVLCWLLSKRLAWAHWVAGAVFFLAGLGSLLGGLVSLSGGHIAGLGVLGIALAYFYCAATLLLSKEVGVYMRGLEHAATGEPQPANAPANESANES